MEPLLWTFEDVAWFVTHPDRPVRQWAQEHLLKHFGDRSAAVLVTMLDDENDYLALRAVEFLARTGDRERYGPPLLARLQAASGLRFGHLAQALAQLQVREALPLILEHLKAEGVRPGSNEYLWLVRALGIFGGEEARRALWAALHAAPTDVFWAGALSEALLEAAQPEDVIGVVRHYRSLRPAEPKSRHLAAFATAAGVGRLSQELGYVAEQTFDVVLERAEWWLGRAPAVSQAALHELAVAYRDNDPDFLDVVRHEVLHLSEERGDRLAAWRADWEAGSPPPEGYRRETLLTRLILDELAAQPSLRLDQHRQERALGMALLCHLSVNSDDLARLEGASDPDSAALAILTENRERVLPDIVERVAAQGPDVVPQLVAMLERPESDWSRIRVAEMLTVLARRYPGSCDGAIAPLIETISDGEGDFLLEASADALAAIGPAAVEQISQHLRDDDIARQIYLTGVLGEIPITRAAQAILGSLDAEAGIEEMHLTALTEIGSAVAIAPLYALWQPGDRLLAQALLVLCVINDIEKPELPLWRETGETEDLRQERIMSEALDLRDRIEILPPESSPVASSPRSSRSAKGPGKKEQKKRAQQRKKTKKKR